jgi:hypothetical protein
VGAASIESRPLETSICAFVGDLVDEGIEAVLDNVQHRAGLGGVAVAAVYHAARDLFPHNPRRKLGYLLGGGHHFPPDLSLYAGLRIQPVVAETSAGPDALAEVCEAAGRRGLQVDGWTVYLHADRSGIDPECSPRNAFGDPVLTDLCPANPHARAYARAVTGDVCRYRVTRILAESLHHHGLDHGFHHERSFLGLGPRSRFLLGLCFCEHCVLAAAELGVDGEAVRRVVRAELEDVFAEQVEELDAEITRDEIGSLADGELGGYLQARCGVVESIARELTEIADAAGKQFAFVDLAGGVKGYASGRPTGLPAVETSWQFGVEPEAVAAVSHQLEVVGYAADPARMRLDLEAYRARLGPEREIAVALRPSPPDSYSPEELRTKVAIGREIGAARVDFYHYGFARLSALDWIREALN